MIDRPSCERDFRKLQGSSRLGSSATAGIALTSNKGLNLVAASAFTQPGTAAGTVKVWTTYRLHTL